MVALVVNGVVNSQQDKMVEVMDKLMVRLTQAVAVAVAVVMVQANHLDLELQEQEQVE